MLEIEFSVIPDFEVEWEVFQFLVQEFEHEYGVHVRLRRMTWAGAWAELMGYVANSRNPHISHIGGTWTSSLASMQVLRPFTSSELRTIGGPSAFLRPAWKSAHLVNDNTVFSLPWTGHMYVICYRKDLLHQAGIDTQSAFDTAETLFTTIQHLAASNLEVPWLIPLVPPPYFDYLHMSASWVWAMGGDFIDPAGKKLIFDSPEARHGLCYWLESCRKVKPEYWALDDQECLHLFGKGKAACVLTDIMAADSFLTGDIEPIVRSNLGVASLTNVPWCTGSNIVIWNSVRNTPPALEKAVVDFALFLASTKSQQRWGQATQAVPARLDALDEIYQPNHPIRPAIDAVVQQGRSYPGIGIWRRLESQLAMTLGEMVEDCRIELNKPIRDMVDEKLPPLAKRLNLALSH